MQRPLPASPDGRAVPEAPPRSGLRESWRAVLGYGMALWAVPFVAGMVVFPLRDGHRALFESLMAVALVAAVVACGVRYLRRYPVEGVAQGLALGAAWMAVSIAADQAFFSWGPMKMPVGEYAGDIALTYLVVPAITAGLAAVRTGNGAPGR